MNDVQTFNATTESIEHVSSLITRYAMIEELYLRVSSAATEHLAESLVYLYTAILQYLLRARRYYARNTAGTMS